MLDFIADGVVASLKSSGINCQKKKIQKSKYFKIVFASSIFHLKLFGLSLH